jgi:uncharacterized BrkB/YihY/UPF0761 family membrane protein
MLIMFTMLCWILVSISSNLWLTHWVNSNDYDHNSFYLAIYSGLSISFAFFCLFRTAEIFLMNIKSSLTLH